MGIHHRGTEGTEGTENARREQQNIVVASLYLCALCASVVNRMPGLLPTWTDSAGRSHHEGTKDTKVAWETDAIRNTEPTTFSVLLLSFVIFVSFVPSW